MVQVESKRNFGFMIPIVMDRQTMEPKYYLGPHFYVVVPTWLGSIGLFVFILSKLVNTSSPWLLVLCVVFAMNFLYYYAKTALSSPGIASSSQQPDLLTRRSQRYCVPCRIIRPLGTKHCYFCDVCIIDMDHHCPWVGKCIGRDNLCLFYKFLVSVFAMLACLLVTALTATTSPGVTKL